MRLRPLTPGFLTQEEVSYWLAHKHWDDPRYKRSAIRMLLSRRGIEPSACLVKNRKGTLLYRFSDLEQLAPLAKRNRHDS